MCVIVDVRTTVVSVDGTCIELELELIQSQMAQKPVLRGEVGARAWRVGGQARGGVGRAQKCKALTCIGAAATPGHAAACGVIIKDAKWIPQAVAQGLVHSALWLNMAGPSAMPSLTLFQFWPPKRKALLLSVMPTCHILPSSFVQPA